MALDYGISEKDFWEMTLAELNRYLESYKRVLIREERKKATFDYLLADLIGKSVARVYNSKNEYPQISEVYPSLFSSEEIEEKVEDKKTELSVLRFKLFAKSFNSRFKEVQKD